LWKRERTSFYGTSVYLDAISLTKIVEGQLLIMVSGDEDTIIDDMSFLTKYIRMDGFHFMGVVINKVAKIDDFNEIYLPRIRSDGRSGAGRHPFFS